MNHVVQNGMHVIKLLLNSGFSELKGQFIHPLPDYYSLDKLRPYVKL